MKLRALVIGLLLVGLGLGCGSSRQAEAPKDTKDYGGKAAEPEPVKLPPPPK
jgi:hypothetical protein